MPTLRSRLLAALLALVTAALLLALPAPATAVPVTEHGIGHVWQRDDRSFIGSYRLADGRLAFCLQAGAPTPLGNDYAETDAAALGLSGDAAARVAELTRRWSTTSDADTAAAAQLAIWTVTGLNGRDPAAYAARANGQAARVQQLAGEMLATVDGPSGASRGAAASLRFDLRADGTGTIVADLDVDYVAGGVTRLAPGTVTGTLELTGATGLGGAATVSVGNGVPVEVRVTDAGAVLAASAVVGFGELPYGGALVTATSPAGSQNLVLAAPTTATATAQAERSVVSALPFQPRVVTQTSAAVAEAGAPLTDRLEVSVDLVPGASTKWPVVDTDAGRVPVAVTVRSRLLGPFFAPPVEAEAAPDGAGVACEVTTVVSAPGGYDTPPCTLPAPGYYVWVESIAPADAPHGGEKVLPWQGRFGVASETTIVPFAPLIETVASPQNAAPESCVADRLLVSRLNPAAGELEVTSILWGPFSERPVPGTALAADAPEAGRVTTRVASDGEHASACVEVEEPGFYVFTYESPGATAADGTALVPAFEDRTVYEAETVTVREQLAQTGPLDHGLLFAALGLLGIGALVVAQGRRRSAR